MSTTPPSLLSTPAEAPKPGLPLLIGTTLLVVLNMGLNFTKTMRATGNSSQALGAAMAPLVMAVIVALLFSISKKFRNARSSTKVVFWTSLILFLSAAASLGRH